MLAALTSCTSNQDREQIKSANSDKPNIIFIYTDDMGYGDLACYGSKVNRTPNLDRMAEEGMRFTDFYSASPLSSPSRAALMTGRYPNRMGINGVFFPGSPTGLPAEEITIAEALKDEGYHTGLVGKWHLGSKTEFLPLQNGFKEYFGIPYSNDMNPSYYMRGNVASNRVVNQDSITYNYTQEAIKFLDNNKDKPFFLYLAHNMPHVPLGASPNFKGKSPNGLYADVIEEIDWSVGQVLAKLDELGLSENTLVIFSSDNGPWLSEGPYGGVATPFFQGKNTNWEGGQHVPAIARWKGKIKPNQVNTDLAIMVDWFPTFINMVGGKIPTDRVIDGKDISSVLFDGGKRENQDFIYLSKVGRFMGVRSGDWKILLPEPIRKGNFWEADVPAHDTLLFNVRQDIGETTDLRLKEVQKFAEMKEKLNKAKESMKDCPPSLFLMEMQTSSLTNMQRIQTIEEAKKKGITSKSKGGEISEKVYEASKAQMEYMKSELPF